MVSRICKKNEKKWKFWKREEEISTRGVAFLDFFVSLPCHCYSLLALIYNTMSKKSGMTKLGATEC